MATIKEHKAKTRSTFNIGFNLVKYDPVPLNPSNELIFNVAD
jgi:hypothetical protein